jgi:hypothetical protein
MGNWDPYLILTKKKKATLFMFSSTLNELIVLQIIPLELTPMLLLCIKLVWYAKNTFLKRGTISNQG